MRKSNVLKRTLFFKKKSVHGKEKNLLKLDYDMPLRRARKLFHKRIKLASYFADFEVDRVTWRHSPSGNTHAIVECSKNFHPFEQVFLQLYLGSDAYREFMNFMRIRNRIKNWNVLFIRKV